MFGLLLSIFVTSKNKAVLYAGSSGWSNYRHQADIWTIYQELLRRGFETDDIVIACYDDISSHHNNPFKGQIFHYPDHKTNVYSGSKYLNYKNYITDKTFYEMLLNLGTNSDDNLFIFYDDHGGRGLLSIPNEEAGCIYADDLTEVLNKMIEKKMFKNCLFLIEACNSGSVGGYIEKNLNKNDNIAIITAAQANESSAADIFDLWTLSYLSNQFTANFIEKIKVSPDCSIKELFEYLVSYTDYSTPVYFCDRNILNHKISDYIGSASPLKMNKIKSNPIPQPLVSKKINESLLKSNIDAKRKMKIKMDFERDKERTKKMENVLLKIKKSLNFPVLGKSVEKNEIDSEITKDYLEIVKHFNKKFGPIRSDDLPKVTYDLLMLSKIAPKNKILEAIDTIRIV